MGNMERAMHAALTHVDKIRMTGISARIELKIKHVKDWCYTPQIWVFKGDDDEISLVVEPEFD